MFGYVVTLMKFGEANLEMSQGRRNSQLPVCPLVPLDWTRALDIIICDRLPSLRRSHHNIDLSQYLTARHVRLL
jgi:hypothetical protein